MVHVGDAEAPRCVPRNLQAGNGHVRPVVQVVLEEDFVIHAVDVVPRKDQHILGARGLEVVHVLIDRVRCAAVPGVLVHALLGGEHVHVFVKLSGQEGPAELQVLQQAMRVVLSQHHNLAEARVHAVRQGEVDDAVLAAKVEARLGIVVREVHQPLAAPTRHDKGDGVPGRESRFRNRQHGRSLGLVES